MSMAKGMSRAVRREWEELFGSRFDDVRIHQHDGTAPLARTHGSDLHFAPGAYDPATPLGRELLAHELAHVLQQRHGRTTPGADPRALELEAVEAGRRAARGEPVRIPGRPTTHRRPMVQNYTVYAAANFAAQGIAVVNPQQHAPTQNQDSFVGQTKGALGGAASSFLTAAGAVNTVSANPAAVSLRFSQNRQMAIEDADLTTRQPKVCYATLAVINASNARLAMIGSCVRLLPDGPGANQQTVTVGGNVLLRVTPQHATNGSLGLTFDAQQGCDNLICRVLGSPVPPPPRFDGNPAVPPHPLIEYHAARATLPGAPLAVLDDTTAVTRHTTARAIGMAFGAATLAPAGPFTTNLRNIGLNQYANPGVGEGFVICSLVSGVPGAGLAPMATPPTQTDYHTVIGGANPVVMTNLTWGSHWGSVIARDGTDVVTLENYARSSEDAMAPNDTRYYFQMYQTDPGAAAGGQSWHQTWANPAMAGYPAPPAVAPPHLAPTHRPASPGQRSFVNPITLRVAPPADRWDARATAIHGATAVDTVKDHFGNIAAAATADAEVREILKGLYFANTRIAANTHDTPARITSWILALTAAIAAQRFQENMQAADRTLTRIVALRDMP